MKSITVHLNKIILGSCSEYGLHLYVDVQGLYTAQKLHQLHVLEPVLSNLVFNST